MSAHRFVVLTNPIEGTDDVFTAWYDAVHIPEVLKVPGVVAAQRYVLADLSPPEGDVPPELSAPSHRCLVIYDLDSDPGTVMSAFLDGFASGTLSLDDSLDLTSVSLTGWTAAGERRTPS